MPLARRVGRHPGVSAYIWITRRKSWRRSATAHTPSTLPQRCGSPHTPKPVCCLSDHKQSTGSLGAHRSKYASYNKDNDHDERRRRRRRAARGPHRRLGLGRFRGRGRRALASGRRPRADAPTPETDGEERAPSAFLFGELCRVRERAAKSEVEAQALERKLSMAEDLRGVDVARARAASSRALAEALAALRRRAARALRARGDRARADAAAERDEAQTWDRRAEGWAYERNRALARLEAACDDGAAGLARRASTGTATAWRAASSPPSRRASRTARPRATRRSCSRSDMRRPCGAFTVAAMAC